MDVAGLVLGILGIVFGFIIIGIVPSILGIVFSAVSLKRQKNGMAIAGLVCSIIGVCISVIVLAVPTNAKTEVSSNTNTAAIGNTKGNSLEDNVQSDIYYYPDMGDTFAFVLVTNNNDVAVDVDTNVTAYDNSGNIVGAYSNDERCIAPGHSYPIWNYIEGVEDVASMDYTVTVTKSSNVNAIDDEIEWSIGNINDNGVIITVTNNHDYDVEYLEAYALFFNGDTLVGFNNTFIDNVSSGCILQSGATVTEQIDINGYKVDFDRADVYLRATK